jgi:uncharacterized membrane protein (UPF0127 family)
MSHEVQMTARRASIARSANDSQINKGLKNLAACEALPHGRSCGECARFCGSIWNMKRILFFDFWVEKTGYILASCLAVIIFSGSLPSTTLACPYELPKAVVSINGQDLFVELAFIPDTRSCGLSNRYTLGENNGMLFLFPNTGKRTFWMKNTHIPLSIAFMDDAGKIVMIHQMEADQTSTTYHSYQSVRYALEVNQGWFALHGIKKGDKVEMALPAILNIQ